MAMQGPPKPEFALADPSQYLSVMTPLELSFAGRMTEIDRAEWDALASRYGTPLLGWGFLALLEESGSIRPETGWTPSHLLARRGKKLVAAAPFYIKTQSAGEFVFDFEFARAAEALKAPYYPKLVGVVPASPVPVWRIMTAEEEDAESLGALLLGAVAEAARGGGLGGLHLLWVEAEFAELVRAMRDLALGPGRRAPGGGRQGRQGPVQAGGSGGEAFVEWSHQAFLWRDEGYGDFRGYLESFSKNMRRNVLRERQGLARAGLATRMLASGEAAARPGLLGKMAELYELTNDKFGPWAARFLERDFFRRLPEFLPEGWLIGAAFESGSASPVGLSFLLEGERGLWGRYWGAESFRSGLHFELCYNLPIEYALERGIRSFDPGMGSEHKARRGFRSLLAPSFHLAFDRRVAKLFESYLPAANAEEAALCRALDRELPFKQPSPRRGAGKPSSES